jgi:hypothetical protein
MGPSRCGIEDTAPAMVQLAMGWVTAEEYHRRTPARSTNEPYYECGKRKHDAAVARRRKRKRGGPK